VTMSKVRKTPKDDQDKDVEGFEEVDDEES
jgi:hypothetical protein